MQTGLAVAAMSTAAIWNVARCAFVAQMGDTKMNSPGDKPSDSPTPRTEIVKRLRDLHLITCAADEKDSRHNKTLPSIAADCIEELERELAEAIRVRENATNNHMETLEELDKAQADLARAIANHAADLTETQQKLNVTANLAYDPNLQSAQSAIAPRWILDRKPTAKDADRHGNVVAYAECQPCSVVPWEWIEAHAWEAWMPLPSAPVDS